MTALGYLLLGFGGLLTWSGVTNPPGGLWSEFGRVIRGQQPAGKIGTGNAWTANNPTGGGGSWAGAAVDFGPAIAFAKAQLGKPYQYGGTGPNGWDCSGLTQAAYAKSGVTLPRTSELQSAAGSAVAEKDAAPGDAVCFGVTPGAAHHIGIYLGAGQLIHAPHTGGVVEIIPVWHTEPMFYRRFTA